MKLSELPIEIRETGKKPLCPHTMALELLEKLHDRDYYIAHADQSKTMLQNVRDILEISSGGRIKLSE